MAAFYWVETDNNSAGCVQADSKEQATKIAEDLQVGKATAVNVLPYPASPYWNKINHPSFCFQPNKCKGRSSCPRSYACSE